MPSVNERVFHRFQQDAIATKFEMNLDDVVFQKCLMFNVQCLMFNEMTSINS
ncbi:MAG: hypothetical protein ACRC2S_13815 [Waterburya sp.]